MNHLYQAIDFFTGIVESQGRPDCGLYTKATKNGLRTGVTVPKALDT